MRNDGKLGSDWVDNFLICLELLVLDQYSLQPTALGDAGSATVPFTLYDHTDNDALVAANANTFLPLQLENVLFGLQAGPGNPVYDTLANFWCRVRVEKIRLLIFGMGTPVSIPPLRLYRPKAPPS